MNNSNTQHALTGTERIANSNRKKASSTQQLLIGMWVCAVQAFDTFFCWPQSSWSITLAFASDSCAGWQAESMFDPVLPVSIWQQQPADDNLRIWQGCKVSWNFYTHDGDFMRSPPTSAPWQEASAGQGIDHQRLCSAWTASGLAMTVVCLTDHLGSSMLAGACWAQETTKDNCDLSPITGWRRTVLQCNQLTINMFRPEYPMLKLL